MSFKHLETAQVGLPTIHFIDLLLNHFQSGAVLSDPHPSECSITVMRDYGVFPRKQKNRSGRGWCWILPIIHSSVESTVSECYIHRRLCRMYNSGLLCQFRLPNNSHMGTQTWREGLESLITCSRWPNKKTHPICYQSAARKTENIQNNW